jgi:Zn-dependent M28 family amino/carboxypeptidase
MKSTRRMVRRAAIVATVVGSLFATSALPIVEAAPSTARLLERAVTVRGIEKHLDAFQAIASANGGTRAASTDGYDISADYVVDQLKQAGYTPEIFEFEYDSFEVVSPAEVSLLKPFVGSLTEPNNISTFTYSGSGDVEGALKAVDVGSATSGCEPEDFTEPLAGAIAVIKRGGCPFLDKATNAVAAGASAVIIFNDGAAPDRFDAVQGTLGQPFEIPVVSASAGAGYYLAVAASQSGTGGVSTETINDRKSTFNVIAQTTLGDPENVVMLGAHLDSVAEGPGINDNGSGSATILEIAIQANKLPALNNGIRFGFWGAEELGLIGSTEYVASLDEAALGKIALNLNFDMVGSPNYARFVYDGDGSSGDAAGPKGSGAIENAFLNYFTSKTLATAPTAFDGRSDYGPFIDAGIPAGGLFTGAEGIKTADEVALFGGTADVAYDVCYHQACDIRTNINRQGLIEMSRAAANVTGFFAQSTLTVNGVFEGNVAGDAATAPVEFDRVADLWVR